MNTPEKIIEIQQYQIESLQNEVRMLVKHGSFISELNELLDKHKVRLSYSAAQGILMIGQDGVMSISDYLG